MERFLGSDFGDYWLMFSLLLASSVAGMQRIAGRATQACSQYFAYTMFDVVIVIASVVSSIVLVKQYGPFGGGMALAIAFGLGLVVTLIHTYRFLWSMGSDDVVESPKGGLSEAGSSQ